MMKIILFMMFMFLFNKEKWLIKELMMFLLLLIFILLMPSMYNLIYYFFFIDMMSYGMMILTSWIVILMIMSSEKLIFNNYLYKNFLFLCLFLLLFLIMAFSIMDLFLYYLFFEMSIIPTLLLILGWGYQPERLQASFYLLFYTLIVSLPLLMLIFFYLNNNYSLIFFFLKMVKYNTLIMFMFMMAFLVKMPMFLVHLWLPKAHVEAPISGSMILAGVLLKLGGYGLLRIFFFMVFLNKTFIFYMVSINLLGGLLISISCLNQIDFKSLIAYSSVVHMSLILSSIFNFSVWSFNSSYLMMLAHGLCSSGMFFLANISYERLSNRSLMISKGLLNIMPSLSLWWFLLLSSNMAAPPSLNLLSEISLLNSILNWSIWSMTMLMFLFFFSAAYCIYLFSISQHGTMYSVMYSYSNNTIREYLILFLHWFPINILILKSNFLFLWI